MRCKRLQSNECYQGQRGKLQKAVKSPRRLNNLNVFAPKTEIKNTYMNKDFCFQTRWPRLMSLLISHNLTCKA